VNAVLTTFYRQWSTTLGPRQKQLQNTRVHEGSKVVNSMINCSFNTVQAVQCMFEASPDPTENVSSQLLLRRLSNAVVRWLPHKFHL